MERLARASRCKSGAILAGTFLLVGTVACDNTITPPGKEISGTIRIPAALKPLLPSAGGEKSKTLQEVEPNGYPLPEGYSGPDFQDIGTLETDGAPVTITGSMDHDDDPRDRFAFQLSEPGSVTITVTHSSTAAVNHVFIMRGSDEEHLAYERISGRNDDPEDQVTLSMVLPAGETFLLHMRYYQEGTSTDYSATIQVQSGTVVGKIYVGAFDTNTPYLIDDPIANDDPEVEGNRLPLGGNTVVDLEYDANGDLVGTFDGVFVRNRSAAWLYAYADNDGTNTAAALNFTRAGPPSSADFIIAEAVPIDLSGGAVGGIEMVIDTLVDDSDFDGVLDADRDGNGLPDDNCLFDYNPSQADADGDGVGDVCDNCPDVANPSQTNTDHVGKGDACNDSTASACPYFFLRAVASCPSDADGDELEETYRECPDYDPICEFDKATVVVNDNCPEDANPDQADNDFDALDEDFQLRTGAGFGGDACDDDDDNDGRLDDSDNCAGQGNADQTDGDADGIGNACDNCPETANPDQADANQDGTGDACSSDDDGDGLADDKDNCPTVANDDQIDSDGDGVGDACDICVSLYSADQTGDSDGDGIGDACDNCPEVANASQTDTDENGVGDACSDDADGDGTNDDTDNCIGVNNDQTDTDSDGFGDDCDSCPGVADANQADSDGDGVGDACDLCVLVADDQTDTDGNGVGDACDPDNDGDGICDPGVVAASCTGVDNCPLAANPDQADEDSNGIGNACDADTDEDGVYDDADNCPAHVNSDQADTDSDGVGDACDNCAAVSNADQEDSDGDGIGDLCDICPQDADADQGDADSDGVGDACDSDADNDGIANEDDSCPLAKVHEGDADSDGVDDVCDNCLGAPNPNQTDVDGDGDGDVCDVDLDGDGYCNPADAGAADCSGVDNCPVTDNPAQSDEDSDGIGDLCDPDASISPVFESEPNDNSADSQFFGYLPGNKILRIEGEADPSDSDHFTVVAPGKGTMVFDMSWKDTDVDHDLVVYLPQVHDKHGPLPENYDGATGDNPEHVAITVTEGQVVELAALGYLGRDEYTLDLRWVTEVEDPADPYAENDVGIVAGSWFDVHRRQQTFFGDLTGDARGWFHAWNSGRTAEEEEVDVWKFTPKASGDFTIIVAYESSVDLLDMFVYSKPVADRTSFTDGSIEYLATGTSPEKVTISATAGEPIYVDLVRRLLGSGEGENDYSITVYFELP
jgi:hypothetical protein